MPEQALYLKWRPTTFEDVVGQDHITRTLRNAIKSDRVRHAYLLSGPRGTGKTTSARLLAKALNCTGPDPDHRPCNACSACIAVNEGRFLDLIEIDAATHTSVDDVRDLRDKIAFQPGEGRYKVYIIDEVHRFSGSAFDALLKTLEEPPDHAIFVLATTEIDRVPDTIKSRCLQFEFRRLTVREVADRLQRIVDAEGIRAERAALEIVARQGTGSVRDSISLLDQIITDPDQPLTAALVEQVLGTASSETVRALADALIVEDMAEGLRVIHRALDHGIDPRQFGAQIVDHLRALLIAQTAGADMLEASPDERARLSAQAARIDRALLVRALRAFNDATVGARGGWQPQLGLELALIDSLSAPAAPQTVIVQQSAAPAAIKEPPPPPVVPVGEPGVLPASQINARWDVLVKTMEKYSRTSPEVMRHYRAQRVNGNVVTVVTDKHTLFERVQPFAEKRQLIETGLREVFRQELRVHIALVTPDEMAALMSGAGDAPGGDVIDPLITTGRELGAKVTPLKKPKRSQPDDPTLS